MLRLMMGLLVSLWPRTFIKRSINSVRLLLKLPSSLSPSSTIFHLCSKLALRLSASVKQVVSGQVEERLGNSGQVESSSQGLLALLGGYASKYVRNI